MLSLYTYTFLASASSGYEQFNLLEYNTVYSVESQSTFRRTVSPPSSGSISQERNRLCLPPAFTLVSCSAYSSTLKMEAICSSETSVYFQRTTRRYMPEDGTLQLPINFTKKF
jgi:hypothetical protein